MNMKRVFYLIFVLVLMCFSLAYIQVSSNEEDNVIFSVPPISFEHVATANISWPEEIVYPTDLNMIHKERYRRIETSDRKCFPYTYGVLPEYDEKYFITRRHKCMGKLDNNKILIENNLLKFTCNISPSVYIGNDVSEEMIGEHDYGNSWTLYSQPIPISSKEFAFGKCGYKSYAVLRNLYNDTVFTRARTLSEDLHNKSETVQKPFTFLYIILDSLSRQNFYRSLQSTAQYIKAGLNPSRYKTYDFLLNNIEDTDTVSNITPMLLGNKLKDHKDIVNGLLQNPEDHPKFLQQQNKTALWKMFERQGFVTLFSSESSKDFISSVTGRKILTDHTIGGFWRSAAKEMKFTDFTPRAQCIAYKMPHDYSLSYLKEFIQNYNGANKAAFVHINTAHEESCTRVKTLDTPLKEFLEFILNYNEDEKVIVIAGDHGRYYYSVNIESYTEKTLPAHFVIASSGLVDRLGLDSSLKYNEDKLISRLDWYDTVKSISLFPYLTGKPKDEEVQAWKTNINSLNLFFEEVNENRDCFDIRVNPEYCLCHNMIAKPKDISIELSKIVEDTVGVINRYINNNNLNDVCGVISKFDIQSVISFEFEKDKVNSVKIFVEVLTQSSNGKLVISAFIAERKSFRQYYNKNGNLSKSTELLKQINSYENSKYIVYDIRMEKSAIKEVSDKNLQFLCI